MSFLTKVSVKEGVKASKPLGLGGLPVGSVPPAYHVEWEEGGWWW